jgi:zinc transporter ZupT
MKTDWLMASAAVVLSIALAIQNFPEALFVSMPINDGGAGTGKSFLLGVISGVPVPLMGLVTLLVTLLFGNILPYVMSLAAGAMIYATVEEIPQISSQKDNDKGTLAFVISFAIVMIMMFAGR